MSTQITSQQVRDDFNDPVAVAHYTEAAQDLGLWSSEERMIKRWLPDHDAPLLEAGCGAGRVSLALWQLGYRHIHAFDFAEELVAQAQNLAHHTGASDPRHPQPLRIFHADVAVLDQALAAFAKTLPAGAPPPPAFAGALFMFNGLMQIPGRGARRTALRQLAAACAPAAIFIFTTHDRDHSRAERAAWRLEAARWEAGQQDPRLLEYGDRYFSDVCGRTFMHLPDRAEILADLAATGWQHETDRLRHEIARETPAIHAFSDECRFWVARRA